MTLCTPVATRPKIGAPYASPYKSVGPSRTTGQPKTAPLDDTRHHGKGQLVGSMRENGRRARMGHERIHGWYLGLAAQARHRSPKRLGAWRPAKEDSTKVPISYECITYANHLADLMPSPSSVDQLWRRPAATLLGSLHAAPAAANGAEGATAAGTRALDGQFAGSIRISMLMRITQEMRTRG